jgi:hypothetical protein
MQEPIDHRKGMAAVIAYLAVISAPFLGVRLLTASLADPTWLVVDAVVVIACVLGRRQILSFLRSFQSPPDSRP